MAELTAASMVDLSVQMVVMLVGQRAHQMVLLIMCVRKI